MPNILRTQATLEFVFRTKRETKTFGEKSRIVCVKHHDRAQIM